MFALALAAAQAGKTRSGHSVRAGPAAAGGANPHFERGFSLSEPDKMGATGARGGPRPRPALPELPAAPALLRLSGEKVCGAPTLGARPARCPNFHG